MRLLPAVPVAGGSGRHAAETVALDPGTPQPGIDPERVITSCSLASAAGPTARR
jgi:hypothetical protein